MSADECFMEKSGLFVCLFYTVFDYLSSDLFLLTEDINKLPPIRHEKLAKL